MCRIEDAYDEGRWLAEPHERTARKQHGCGDCGRRIEPGERYTAGTWIWDGRGGVLALKMCVQCVAAGAWLRKVCGGHFWPGVMEELGEHWEEEWEYRSLGLGQLILSGRRHWQRRGQLVPVEQVSAWVDAALAKVPETAH